MVLVLVMVWGVNLGLLLTGVLIRAGRLHHIEAGALCRPLHTRTLTHRWQSVLQVGVLNDGEWVMFQNR